MTNVKSFAEKLLGSTIALYKNEEAAADEMFRVIDKHRKALSAFLPWPERIRSLKDQVSYLRMTSESWKQKALFDYGIYHLANQNFIGNFGVHSIDWRNSRCELGYWIVPELEGRGLVSEALRLVEAECFKVGFHRIEIRCSSRNEKSAKVALRNNFILEGILKDEVIEGGQYRDTYVFAKLAAGRQRSKPADN